MFVRHVKTDIDECEQSIFMCFDEMKIILPVAICGDLNMNVLKVAGATII